MALDKIGYLKLSANDSAGALAAYEESLAITRRLADTDPNDINWQRDIAVGLNKMGDVKFFASGDAKGAIAEYEESLGLARRLADKNQGNAQLQRDMSVSLDKIGDVKRSQNDNAGALAVYDESLAIARHLAGVDPGNVQWQTDLVVSLYKIALLADGEKKSGAVDEALKSSSSSTPRASCRLTRRIGRTGCWRCASRIVPRFRSSLSSVTPLTEGRRRPWQGRVWAVGRSGAPRNSRQETPACRPFAMSLSPCWRCSAPRCRSRPLPAITRRPAAGARCGASPASTTNMSASNPCTVVFLASARWSAREKSTTL